MPDLKVHSAGIMTTVQGAPQVGKRHWGVGGGGAWDQEAQTKANLMLGNEALAPILEMTLRGPRIEFSRETRLVCSGGDIDCLWSGFSMNKVLTIQAGQVLDFGYIRTGIRTYLAVDSGFEDKCHGLLLKEGDELIFGKSVSEPGRADFAELDFSASLAMAPGPDFEVLGARADSGLRVWLQPQSTRQAIILEAKNDLTHEVSSDFSRPLFPGFAQLLPNGKLAVIGPDGHTMGGYPRVGVLDQENYSKLGRLRPGTKIEISIDQIP